MGFRQSTELSNRIGRLASELGLSDGEIARAAGLSRSHLNRIKNGRSIPRVDTALAIAAALEQRVRDVFFVGDTKC